MGLVSDYFSFQNGYAFKSSDFTDNGEYKIVKIKELKDGTVKFFEDTAEINPSSDFDVEKYIIQKGDVLFALTGDPVNKPNPLSWVGRVSYYTHDEPALLNQRVCKAVPKSDVPSEYLYYFFRQNGEFYNLASKATGSASQANISTKTIEQHVMEIPDSDTVKKIVDFMRNIDDKIENNNQINRNLSEQIQLLYSEYFECEKAENWDTVPLSDLIFFQEGPGIRNWQYVEEDGTKFINIRCINNGDIDVTTANMISNEEAEGKYAHFMLKPYDIVMSCSGTLGRYAIVREEHLPLCLNTSVIRFSPVVTPDDFSYVYGYMTSKEFLNRQREMACGSVQANFGPTHLKKMEIHEPPQELRNEYHKVVFPIIKQMICLRKENDRLAKTRDSLLPKLMSGELDVSSIDI